MNKPTPMMQQYLELKDNYKDSILLFRLGDFYETFFSDAEIAARELDLVLTGKDCGLEHRAPMCGVPYHAVDSYISKLVNRGYKIAICEQLENPSEVKGIVKRAVTRVITPGTVVEPSMLDEQDNNYIVAICVTDTHKIELAYCDISTGEFSAAQHNDENELLNELYRLMPKEAVVPDSKATLFIKIFNKGPLRATHMSSYMDWAFEKSASNKALSSHFGSAVINNLENNGFIAAGALIQYLHDTQKNALLHINHINSKNDNKYLQLDSAAIKNLELIRSITDGKTSGSLFWLMNKTKTALGARELKRQILHPEYNKTSIINKQNAVEELLLSKTVLKNLGEALSSIRDLERIISRVSYEKINAKDCISLRDSLRVLPDIKNILSQLKSDLFFEINNNTDLLTDISDTLERAISEDAPFSITDGGIIKKGYNKDLDQLIERSENINGALVEFEEKERQKTGIKTLKVRYNRVFGYSIEITKSYLKQLPYNYIRKQTLSNSERFVTEELKEIEKDILEAQSKRNTLEFNLFVEIRTQIEKNIKRIQSTAKAIAFLDTLQSLAVLAYENDYVKPNINDDGILEIKNSRHPVLEKLLKEKFVPNDIIINKNNKHLLLITGPNMAGKSTYMRQTALLVLMTHMGGFVPADNANVCLTDKIYTRVGASDDLAGGQSTFMVEMNELANILRNSTDKSLLILDEIGRGTSTIDGLSIAKASIEYIIKFIGANTLFSTHYHELIEIEKDNPQVHNCSIQTSEDSNEIVFLHKIIDGGTDKSFGIEVAQLAGIPTEVINSAKIHLTQFNNKSETQKNDVSISSNFTNILTVIQKTDVNSLTPLEALNLLNSLKKEYTNGQ